MKLKDVKILSLGLTDECNGRCLMCWHSNALLPESTVLSVEMYEHVRDSLFGHIKILDLCGGGEVMLYPDIKRVLEDIKKFRFKTRITSNFASISDEQRNILKDMNVEFVVSLDGSTKLLQETLRPGCDFNKIVDNIKFFRKHGKRVMIQTTLSYQNHMDVANILELAASFGVESVIFQEVLFLANLDVPYKVAKAPKDTQYSEFIIDKKRKFLMHVLNSLCIFYTLWCRMFRSKYCPNTVRSLKIQENGMVLSCCLPDSRILGDLHHNTLKDILGYKSFDDNRLFCECSLRQKQPVRAKNFKRVAMV